jgi:hypothetical protein
MLQVFVSASLDYIVGLSMWSDYKLPFGVAVLGVSAFVGLQSFNKSAALGFNL